MSPRVPKQAVLPFTRSDRSQLARWRRRELGEKIGRGLGRPRKRKADDVTHATRPSLGLNTSVHVTLRLRGHVPTLRSRRRFAEIRAALAQLRVRGSVPGFRVVHYAVLGNHMHLVVEADGKEALSSGMQRVAHSISRRLNALGVLTAGGTMSPLAGPYATRLGWLGRVFAERYHQHVLGSRAEIARALDYLFLNAKRHFGASEVQKANQLAPRGSSADPFSSFAVADCPDVIKPAGYLLRVLCRSFALS